MSDESDTNGSPSSNGEETNGAHPPPGTLPLVVNVQYVKDLSFENPNAPQSLMTGGQPQLDVQVDVQARGLGEQSAEVVLSIRAEATQPGESGAAARTVFIAELAYAGVFSFPALPQDTLRALLLIEAPRLLFPFARQIIAEATQSGGYPGLLLQPIDFVDLFRRQVMGGRSAQTADA